MVLSGFVMDADVGDVGEEKNTRNKKKMSESLTNKREGDGWVVISLI